MNNFEESFFRCEVKGARMACDMASSLLLVDVPSARSSTAARGSRFLLERGAAMVVQGPDVSALRQGGIRDHGRTASSVPSRGIFRAGEALLAESAEAD